MSSVLTCKNCGKVESPIIYKSGPHLRADCPTCFSYIKFVSPSEGWIANAEAKQVQPEKTSLSLFGDSEPPW